MSAFSDFFTALNTKYASSSYVTDTDNIVFGESVDVMSLGEDSFPRLETLVIKAKCNGYADQRNLEWALRFGTAGFIKVDNDTPHLTLSELSQITNFGVETVSLVYQLLDDKQSGSLVLDSFEKFGEYPEIFIEKELFPNTVAFLFAHEAHFLLPDTEVL